MRYISHIYTTPSTCSEWFIFLHSVQHEAGSPRPHQRPRDVSTVWVFKGNQAYFHHSFGRDNSVAISFSPRLIRDGGNKQPRGTPAPSNEPTWPCRQQPLFAQVVVISRINATVTCESGQARQPTLHNEPRRVNMRGPLFRRP